MHMLEKITKENDIKQIERQDYPALAAEIRDFLIEKVSIHGGHLASNLGTVELTMALHAVMNFPEDKLIFDVGHQSYTHKILTGRKDAFETLRQYDGLSGFPNATRVRAMRSTPDTVRLVSQRRWGIQSPEICAAGMRRSPL